MALELITRPVSTIGGIRWPSRNKNLFRTKMISDWHCNACSAKVNVIIARKVLPHFHIYQGHFQYKMNKILQLLAPSASKCVKFLVGTSEKGSMFQSDQPILGPWRFSRLLVREEGWCWCCALQSPISAADSQLPRLLNALQARVCGIEKHLINKRSKCAAEKIKLHSINATIARCPRCLHVFGRDSSHLAFPYTWL